MFNKLNILFNIYYKLFVTIAISVNYFSFSTTDNMDDAMPAKKSYPCQTSSCS